MLENKNKIIEFSKKIIPYSKLPLGFSIIGFGLSLCTLFFFPFLTLIPKCIGIIGSIGAGYGFGDWMKDDSKYFLNFLMDDDIWDIINKKIVIPKEKINKNQPISITIENAKKLLDNENNPINTLYHFVVMLFIERFNLHKYENKNLMKEINVIIELLTIKHPYYKSGLNKELIKGIIEELLMKDLKEYLYIYYNNITLSQNKKIFKKNFYLSPFELITRFLDENPNIKIRPIILNSIILKSSNIFTQIPSLSNREKQTIALIKCVSIIDEECKKLNIRLSCDELLPLITLLIKYNYHICPSGMIKMLYDMLGEYTDEKGYISTLMITASEASID